MKHYTLKKTTAFVMAELVEYEPHSVLTRPIIDHPTGDVNAVSFDSGAEQTFKVSPFDTLIEVIEGRAEIVIDNISNFLNTGQCIIVPAHTTNTIKANERFKMLSTVIKNGYE